MNRLHATNTRPGGWGNPRVRMTWILAARKCLCVGSGVFSVEVFFEGARLMAASEGAGEGNVMGSASIKDFLEGMARVEPPRVGTRGVRVPAGA